MKVKLIFIVFSFITVLSYQTAAQTPVPEDYFDLYEGDEDEEYEDGNGEAEFNMGMLGENPLGMINAILSDEKAGPVGNWMSDSFVSMVDATAHDAPKEYLCAKNIRLKYWKVISYEAVIAKGTLTCEERKKIMESYSLFLGTIYLDIFCMDFFTEKGTSYKWTNEQMVDIVLGFNDADTMFAKGQIDRSEFGHINEWCLYDLLDLNVKQCGEYLADYLTGRPEIRNNIDQTLEVLHPIAVASYANGLAEQLSALPCNN
ncbi:hypothetical protein [Constantimarinum furrinae]|uniref:Uncharacterized protein n=1 Tax=Constantimarinum furrinae TaxID=2562285 RepID=A0A7G8PX48_9FLAO|nr:hypothetical protein [Constantimarinum furrinae]QNJ98914.1 hypothetical protein ALE3EI_2376 [Constantimarinum furrinae]